MLKSGGGNCEQIIVDDGSKDNTVDIIQRYTNQYPEIHLVKFPLNRGTNAARNAAIASAKGEYCVILDSDDYLVDDALEIIQSTIQKYPGYSHYMFAADDCQEAYSRNPIIKGSDTKVLLYPDFLNGYITGDFIHVIRTATLRKFPFDEELRTYEGVFFLRFYRKAEKMFFCNKVVTIRERGRNDSVSKEFFRTNDKVIQRKISYLKLNIEWFFTDYVSLGLNRKLNYLYSELIDNLLLASQYNEAKKWMNDLSTNGGKITYVHKVIYGLRLGLLYRIALRCYLIGKYKILRLKFN